MELPEGVHGVVLREQPCPEGVREDNEDPGGVAVRMKNCDGVVCGTINAPNAGVALDVSGGRNVSVESLTCEGSNSVANINNARNVKIEGVHLNRNGNKKGASEAPLVDFKNHQGQVLVTGTISKCPGQVFYLDENGRRQDLGGPMSFADANGRGFALWADGRKGRIEEDVY